MTQVWSKGVWYVEFEVDYGRVDWDAVKIREEVNHRLISVDFSFRIGKSIYWLAVS